MTDIYIVLIALALLLIIVFRRGIINFSLKKLQVRYEKEKRKKERLKTAKQIQERREENKTMREKSAIKNTRKHLAHINSFLRKTELCISKGDTEEAIKLLISILAIDDNHQGANETLAELYMKQKQYKKAEVLFKKLAELYPNNPVYQTNLGHCDFNQKKYPQALKAYENAIRLDQHKSIRYFNLAKAHLAIGHLEQAIENLEQASNLDKRNTNYLFLLANSYVSNQDPIKARECVHVILELEPYNQEAKDLLKEILELL